MWWVVGVRRPADPLLPDSVVGAIHVAICSAIVLYGVRLVKLLTCYAVI